MLGLLPGSRAKECSSLLPLMIDLVELWQKEIGELRVLLIVADSLQVDKVLRSSGADKLKSLRIEVVQGENLKHLALCDAVVAASGTVTLEAALLQVPMVVIYKMSALSFAIAKRVVRLRHVSLVNLVAGVDLVPEVLQVESGRQILKELRPVLLDQGTRNHQLKGFLEIKHKLASGASLRAAQKTLAFNR